MPKTVRGANNSFRVKEQRRQKFSMTRSELEETDKDELLETAERLGVLSDVPRNGSTDTPLKEDLVDRLADVKNETIS